MSGDYKFDIQCIFEEMVDAEFEGKNYWEIPEADQQRIYMKAMHEYADRLADRADMLRDIEKERPR